MKRFVIALALLVSACEERPYSAQNGNPPTREERYQLEFLFDVEGCKVYRFHASFEDRFLTTCPGSITNDYRLGKAGRKIDENQTVVP